MKSSLLHLTLLLTRVISVLCKMGVSHDTDFSGYFILAAAFDCPKMLSILKKSIAYDILIRN